MFKGIKKHNAEHSGLNPMTTSAGGIVRGHPDDIRAANRRLDTNNVINNVNGDDNPPIEDDINSHNYAGNVVD
ncbi:hypothetical protein DPMN_140544 [Dreissena polymorpha]|uniref:Uncharacterized protein n=1 Tax=Dreissena polymorpha TaxID=45954 RepID=A0A9D4JGS6_DREPO|nr:hypothetical protein DPMN_140544 [Dreissena polymorpha]